MARASHANASRAAARLGRIPGVSVLNSVWFNEFTVLLPRDARSVLRELASRRVLGGVALGRLYPQDAGLHHAMLVCASECTTADDITALVTELGDILQGADA